MRLAVSGHSCADLLKVLADETRLAVIEQLIDGPRHVSELNRRLRIDQSLLSHHLRTLREAGFVEADRDGKSVLYRLSSQLRSRASTRGLDLGCCLLSFRSRRERN